MKNHLKPNYHIFCETDTSNQQYISCRTIKHSRDNTNLISLEFPTLIMLEKENNLSYIMYTSNDQ